MTEQDQAVNYSNELLDLIYGQGLVTFAGNLVNAFFLAFVFWGTSESVTLVLWVSSLLVITILRWGLMRLYQDYKSEVPNVIWSKLYMAGVVASGICWASTSIILFEPARPELQLFLTLMLGGMAGGSIPSLAPIPVAAKAYLYLLIIPLALAYLVSSVELAYYMAFLALFFALILTRSIDQAHSSISKGVTLQSENRDLVERLEREREDIDLLNEELKVALITAEDLAEAKDQFLATVSHELRTPMNAVIGMLDLVLNNNHSDEQLECLEVAQSSAKSLMGLIDSVLDFSKVQTRDFSLNDEFFVLKSTLEELEHLFNARLQEKNLQYFAIIDSDIPNVVRGDSLRFKQVLINLLSNSIKFTNKNGVIILYALINESHRDFTSIEFAVADTGIGISENKTKSIFHSFTQAEVYTSRTYGGTGLGLSIVERLINLMGGAIRVKSKLGHGTRFNFALKFPVLSDVEASEYLQANGKELTSGYLASERKLNVLVAEDNKMNQMLMLKLLSSWGHQVTVVSNGREAVQTFESDSFDIILMDCQMPEMDGYAATKTIRQRENASADRIPIVAVTAHARAGEFERCLAAGMQDYLTKPIDSNTLRKKLQDVTKSIADSK